LTELNAHMQNHYLYYLHENCEGFIHIYTDDSKTERNTGSRIATQCKENLIK